MLKYDSIDPNSLYTPWGWYFFPLIGPFLILERIFIIPYENMTVIVESNESIDNPKAHGQTIISTYGNGYINGTKIIMRPNLDIMSSMWHDSLSSDIHRGKHDYLTVVLHELGHVIGLDHIKDHHKNRETLMYTGLRKAKRIASPSKKDMNHIFCEYGKYWNKDKQLGYGVPYGRGTIEP